MIKGNILATLVILWASSPDLFDPNGGSFGVKKIEKHLLHVKECKEEDDFEGINYSDLIYRIWSYMELYKVATFLK